MQSKKSKRRITLRTVRIFELQLLPPILFFSFYPLISLGSSDSMNLELSLPLIWLVIYDMTSLAAFLVLLKKYGFKKNLRGLSDRKFFLFSLFPLFVSLSAFWSLNLPRALLTAGLIWALFFAIFATYELLMVECCKNYNTFRTKFKKSLYISTAIVCVFCWLQCILDLAGVPRECTLLCQGCTYRTFGFPHPNGFAIEPQFMGNLLLAPIFILLFDIIYNHKHRLAPLLGFFLATLFLTFSRGAIYAFGVAFIMFITIRLVKTKSIKPLSSLLLAVLAFAFTLIAQGLMANLSPTNDTFLSGITKSVHQLSLGKIDFRPSLSIPIETENNSSFEGYVEESTNVRLKLSEYAVNLWHQSPATIFFGVGIGGAGTALAEAYPNEFTAKEIIQNEYLSLALEIGLIGLALLTLSIFLVFRKLHNIKRPRSPAVLLFFILGLAFAITLFFFSGLPNALHIYFFLALALINAII